MMETAQMERIQDGELPAIVWRPLLCPDCNGWMLETTATAGEFRVVCSSSTCRRRKERKEHVMSVGEGEVGAMRAYRCKKPECSALVFRSNAVAGIARGNCRDRRCGTRYYAKLARAPQRTDQPV